MSKKSDWGRSRSHHKRLGGVLDTLTEVNYQDGSFSYEWKVRGNKFKVMGDLEDRDYTCYRARCSFGWKNSHHRRQWEHRVIEAEKHARNRLARKKRDGGALFPDE